MSFSEVNNFFKEVYITALYDQELFSKTLPQETKKQSFKQNKNYGRWKRLTYLLPLLPAGVVAFVTDQSIYLLPSAIIVSIILYKVAKVKIKNIEKMTYRTLEKELIQKYDKKWRRFLKFSQQFQNLMNQKNRCALNYF